jgi:hypothetical protein
MVRPAFEALRRAHDGEHHRVRGTAQLVDDLLRFGLRKRAGNDCVRKAFSISGSPIDGDLQVIAAFVCRLQIFFRHPAIERGPNDAEFLRSALNHLRQVIRSAVSSTARWWLGCRYQAPSRASVMFTSAGAPGRLPVRRLPSLPRSAWDPGTSFLEQTFSITEGCCGIPFAEIYRLP